MKSVLIADDNSTWLNILEDGLNREEDYFVIGKSPDGKTAIEMIEKLKPDILLLDIIMPEYDGVYIVNHIHQNMKGYRPYIYILSGIGTDTIIKILNDLDIDFYSMKPISIDTIINNIKKITEAQRQEEKTKNTSENRMNANSQILLINKVKETMKTLGLSPHLFSTKCTVQAVINYINKKEEALSLTKILYPEIAAMLGVSGSSVEKNIRTAIIQIHNINSELYNGLFPNCQKKKCLTGNFYLL